MPRVIDAVADHRVQDAVLMAGVAVGETALDAGVAAVGLAVLVGGHADQFVAAHFGFEGAADATVGAGGDHRMRRGADLDDRLFL